MSKPSEAELVEALRPYAGYGAVLQGQRVRDDEVVLELWEHRITVADLRRAAALLARYDAAKGQGS